MTAGDPSQLARYLALADSVIVEIERLAAGASVFLRSGYRTSERDRVMVALACKADGSFRALIEDRRAGRGEAMHHLKTMAEIFIYFYAVVADDTDKTAMRSSPSASPSSTPVAIAGSSPGHWSN